MNYSSDLYNRGLGYIAKVSTLKKSIIKDSVSLMSKEDFTNLITSNMKSNVTLNSKTMLRRMIDYVYLFNFTKHFYLPFELGMDMSKDVKTVNLDCLEDINIFIDFRYKNKDYTLFLQSFVENMKDNRKMRIFILNQDSMRDKPLSTCSTVEYKKQAILLTELSLNNSKNKSAMSSLGMKAGSKCKVMLNCDIDLLLVDTTGTVVDYSLRVVQYCLYHYYNRHDLYGSSRPRCKRDAMCISDRCTSYDVIPIPAYVHRYDPLFTPENIDIDIPQKLGGSFIKVEPYAVGDFNLVDNKFEDTLGVGEYCYSRDAFATVNDNITMEDNTCFQIF